MLVGSWHEHRLRVRFEETDTAGVVYYAKFLVWFEVGRVSLLRDVGLTYTDWRNRGMSIPVVQAHADYKAPARFDDEILVRTKIAKLGEKSVTFENEVYKLPDMQLLCTGHTVQAMTDGNGKAAPIPEDIREKLTSS